MAPVAPNMRCLFNIKSFKLIKITILAINPF